MATSGVGNTLICSSRGPTSPVFAGVTIGALEDSQINEKVNGAALPLNNQGFHNGLLHLEYIYEFSLKCFQQTIPVVNSSGRA